MKREIKFRAWGKRDKVMQDVGSLSWLNGGIKAYGQGSHIENDDYFVDGDNVTLMQYTGLKDKNGVEIFEGDICRVDHLDKRYTPSNEKITWDKFEGWCVGCGSTTEVHWSHEVIGNIYEGLHSGENPELLTK